MSELCPACGGQEHTVRAACKTCSGAGVVPVPLPVETEDALVFGAWLELHGGIKSVLADHPACTEFTCGDGAVIVYWDGDDEFSRTFELRVKIENALPPCSCPPDRPSANCQREWHAELAREGWHP